MGPNVGTEMTGSLVGESVGGGDGASDGEVVGPDVGEVVGPFVGSETVGSMVGYGSQYSSSPPHGAIPDHEYSMEPVVTADCALMRIAVNCVTVEIDTDSVPPTEVPEKVMSMPSYTTDSE